MSALLTQPIGLVSEQASALLYKGIDEDARRTRRR